MTGRASTVVGIYNVVSAFAMVFLLAIRLTSAQNGSHRGAFYALAGIGLAYSLYLFVYTLFPLTINKSNDIPRTDAAFLAKLAAPIIALAIVYLVPL